MTEENISAIATPAGKGGVAIIRISGKDPLALAAKMFTPTGKTQVKDFEPYRMYPGKIDGGNPYAQQPRPQQPQQEPEDPFSEFSGGKSTSSADKNQNNGNATPNSENDPDEFFN